VATTFPIILDADCRVAPTPVTESAPEKYEGQKTGGNYPFHWLWFRVGVWLLRAA